jgi:6-pyruvoyltetrahydropterin/6-carboxytetrahydropterin synthase
MAISQKIRLTKIFTFEMAHALPGYLGACKNIHGHSYRLEVTIIGSPLDYPGHPNNGMVMDFKELKKIVQTNVINMYDHAMVLPNTAPADVILSLRSFSDNIIVENFQPTCENLLLKFVDTIKKELPDELELFNARLYETATSYAEWYSRDQ